MPYEKKASDVAILHNLQRFQKTLGGVFRASDLYNVIGFDHPPSNQKAISRLVASGILTRVKRGFYVMQDFNLWKLAVQIQNNSYVSMHSVLAERGLTGTLNHNRVDLVTTGLGQTVTFQNYRIRIVSIDTSLFFGFQNNENGVPVADVEKAFLDILYYHSHGHKFAIDPLSEIDLEKLNKRKLALYLQKYKNPKFVKFVRGVLA